MRDAYNRPLNDAEKKTLEENPSYFAEIYIMRADGSDQKRLTNVPGYDGGPFFTPDGSRIVWRRFDEQGLIADVWTMKPDGSDQRQITDFGSMSWAPYMHPSGEYIIFASNKLGFENFELFMVDAQGTKEPVRVTYSDGFDGLPVPSPDGKTLAWTSSRSGGAAGQLFLAQWNHEKALEAVRNAPPRKQPVTTMSRTRDTMRTHERAELVCLCDLCGLCVDRRSHRRRFARRRTAPSTTRAHVEALASPQLEGRLTGSAGERLAATTSCPSCSKIGAKPLPGQADYRVAFEFTAGTRDGGSSITLSASGAADGFSGAHARSRRSPSPTTATSPATVVFAGYGIVVPDGQDFGYDSYATLDVKDKIVLVLRYFPEDAEQKTQGDSRALLRPALQGAWPRASAARRRCSSSPARDRRTRARRFR